MSVATITIYGRDDDPTNGAIVDAVSTVETGVEDTNYWKWTPKTTFNVDVNIEDESEIKEYLNYFKSSSNNIRLKYDLQCKIADFPTTDTAIETLMPLVNVMHRKYIWLHLNDYKITCYSSQTTNAIRVAIDEIGEIENNTGQKEIQITLSELKRNLDRT